MTISDQHLRPWFAGDVWPADDTEESIMGTDLHQRTITNLRLGLNEVAQIFSSAEQPVPWQALSQILVLGFQRPNGSHYRIFPDIFVYPHAIAPTRGSLALGVDGAPVLVIEVLSDATYAVDLDLEEGKGYSYARGGVREYLTLDPMGAFSDERIKGWRLNGKIYQRWEPAEDGCWHSTQLPVAFGLEGILATVYTRDGRRMLREGEITSELARRDEEIARLRQLLQ